MLLPAQLDALCEGRIECELGVDEGQAELLRELRGVGAWWLLVEQM